MLGIHKGVTERGFPWMEAFSSALLEIHARKLRDAGVGKSP
jgi:hypothetical protein